MSTDVTELSVIERSKLENLELVIDTNKDAVIKVANALRTIQTERLYRETHATFDAYVRSRFAFQTAHAYRLIDYAEVAEDVSPVGDIPNERQARELKRLPPEQRSDAWEEAVSAADDKPTSEEVKRVVDRKLGGTDPKEAAPKPSKPGKPREQKTDWVARHEELVAEIRDIAGEIDSSLELLGCARAHRELAELFDRYAEQCER